MMKRAILLAAVSLAGCAPHQFAPGPGKDPAMFTMDSGRCKIYASTLDQGFYAQGRPGFVAGAALGNALGNALREDSGFADCMMANNWVPVAGGAPAPTAPAAYAAPAAAPAGYPQPARLGLIYMMASPGPTPATGGQVTTVLPDSAAAKAGIVVGDVLVSVAGQPIVDTESIHRILPGIQRGTPFPIVLYRGGQRIEIDAAV